MVSTIDKTTNKIPPNGMIISIILYLGSWVLLYENNNINGIAKNNGTQFVNPIAITILPNLEDNKLGTNKRINNIIKSVAEIIAKIIDVCLEKFNEAVLVFKKSRYSFLVLPFLRK